MKRAKLQHLRQQRHEPQGLALEPLAATSADSPAVATAVQRSRATTRVDGTAQPSSAAAEARPSAPARQRLLRAAAERVPLLIRAMGRDEHCRWANSSWSAFTGRSLEQTLGDGWLEAVHADDRALCAQADIDGSESQDFRELEYRLRRANGDFAWIHEYRAPRLRSRGGAAGYLATAVDVTPRKRAELHLELVHEAERLLAQGSSVGEDAASVLALVCRRLEWDVGELWSCAPAQDRPRCLKRWCSDGDGTLDTSAPDVCADPVWVSDIAGDASLEGCHEAGAPELHGMLRLPVPMQGTGQASLRLFTRQVRARDEAVIAVVSCVATRLGTALARQGTTGEACSTVPRKAAILDALPDAVITIDPGGRVVELNAAADALFGFPPGLALGQQVQDLVVPRRNRKRFQERWQQQRASQRRGLMGARFDSPALKADGSHFPAQFAMATLAKREPPCVTICVWDVTERNLAEEAVLSYRARVQSLMSDLLLAEERERLRLARDLHDGLSQSIALAQIKLSSVRTPQLAAIDGPLDQVQQLLEHAHRAVSSIGFELSPLVLHDLGLEPALQWLSENIQERYGITVELHRAGQIPAVDETTRVILFRAIRELLINAAKHSGAQSVRLLLGHRRGSLHAVVSDDGIGMEPDAALSEGSGLLSIRERMGHIGGQMTIDSVRGKGTTVRLSTPLRSGKSKKQRREIR
ncbi:MAG TPA: PAS domain S-box protein [Planctomycetota bacterium]|nr:PAS domain S-box protein [Planctomycetota bacterium]